MVTHLTQLPYRRGRAALDDFDFSILLSGKGLTARVRPGSGIVVNGFELARTYGDSQVLSVSIRQML